jgi:hypothetical protein
MTIDDFRLLIFDWKKGAALLRIRWPGGRGVACDGRRRAATGDEGGWGLAQADDPEVEVVEGFDGGGEEHGKSEGEISDFECLILNGKRKRGRKAGTTEVVEVF